MSFDAICVLAFLQSDPPPSSIGPTATTICPRMVSIKTGTENVEVEQGSFFFACVCVDRERTPSTSGAVLKLSRKICRALTIELLPPILIARRIAYG